MNKMNILVVGGGGREHAIIKKLLQSPKCGELYCCPGNGGISKDAQCVPISATDIDGVVSFAKEKEIDLVVVAPDDPLVLGMVDALRSAGIKAFGPDAKAAIIEGSKAFSKELMKKYSIPTANYEVFEDAGAAVEYIKAQDQYPVVIKADGLALGKGVIIAETFVEAEQAVNEIMVDKHFGKSGSRVVIEEFLTGPEVTVLSFCDGKNLVTMPSSMDHKRAFDGNTGPNTGGMGVIAPNPHYTPEIAKLCEEKIFLPTVEAMRAEGREFKGCLYFGLMLTPNGPKVIEYNCRFGDPETQTVLSLLESDLAEIMLATIGGSLDKTEVKFKSGCAACVVIASGGYPGAYKKNVPIHGLDANGGFSGATIYHAGTAYGNEGFVTNGGRVFGVTAVADTLPEALENAYESARKIKFDGAFFRGDIGRY